jgi:hypothetical protein
MHVEQEGTANPPEYRRRLPRSSARPSPNRGVREGDEEAQALDRATLCRGQTLASDEAIPTPATLASEHRSTDGRSCSEPQAPAHLARSMAQTGLGDGGSCPVHGEGYVSNYPPDRRDRGGGALEARPLLDSKADIGSLFALTPTLSTLSRDSRNRRLYASLRELSQVNGREWCSTGV